MNMNTKTRIALLLASAGMCLSAVAWARTTIDLGQALSAAQAAGYEVQGSAELEGDVYEIQARKPDGQRVEVHVDAASGEILWPAQPGQTQLSMTEVHALLQAAGYAEIVELERDDGYWSAEVRGAAGLLREVRVHPLTGAIEEVWWD